MIKKLAIPLSLAAMATLAACSHGTRMQEQAEARPTQVLGTADSTLVASSGTVSAASVRTGKGKVAYLVDPTGPINGVSTQYVILHMSDGTSQSLTTRGAQLTMGEHIRISQNSNIGRDRYYYHATE
jgi:hypothetical protein